MDNRPELSTLEQDYFTAYQFLAPMRVQGVNNIGAVSLTLIIEYYQVFEPVDTLQTFCRIMRLIDGEVMNEAVKK